MPKSAARKYPWCDPACPSWPHVTHKLDAQTREQYLCPTCKRPARAVFDGTERWSEDRERWYAAHPETAAGEVAEPVGTGVGDGPGAAGEVVRDGEDEPAGAADTGQLDERAASDGEPVPTAEAVVTAPVADPIVFPAPPEPFVADRIEATAAQIQEGFPYRTLLDCRQLAAKLVGEMLCWDADWPEAEGDCGCEIRGLSGHDDACLWNPAAGSL